MLAITLRQVIGTLKLPVQTFMPVFLTFKMNALSAVTFSIFLSAASGVVPRLVRDEERLLTDLGTNYSVHLRPVANFGDVVNISFNFALLKIVHFDEEKEVLHSLVWLHKMWKDLLLRWDPKDYNGISTIRIPSDKIWKPDIILFNSVSDKWTYAVEPLAVVTSDGLVTWIPPMHLHSTCNVDLTKFPFDTQVCWFKFASWTYDGSKVNLVKLYPLNPVDLSSYSKNREWDLVNSTAERNAIKYPCCPTEEYVDLTYTLELSRRSRHYATTVVAPSVILALLLPVIFLLPPGTTEKTTLGAGVLLGLVLMSLLLQDLLPPGAHSVSALAVYNMVCIALTAFSLLLGALVNTVWYKKGVVPQPLNFLFLRGLARLLCVSLDTYYRMPFASSHVTDDKEAPATGEWQLLSMVLDRILLIVFAVSVIITSLVLLI